MNMVRDFFIKIINTYNNLTCGEAVNHIKKDMEVLLLEVKDQIKKELDPIIEGKEELDEDL